MFRFSLLLKPGGKQHGRHCNYKLLPQHTPTLIWGFVLRLVSLGDYLRNMKLGKFVMLPPQIYLPTDKILKVGFLNAASHRK